MTVYYLESSALLKWYKLEPGSTLVNDLFDGKVAGESFVTSHLTILEVNSVAARLLRGRAVTRGQYGQMVGTALRDLEDYGVVVLPVSNTLVADALDLLPRYALRTADALHFAAALRVSRVFSTNRTS